MIQLSFSKNKNWVMLKQNIKYIHAVSSQKNNGYNLVSCNTIFMFCDFEVSQTQQKGRKLFNIHFMYCLHTTTQQFISSLIEGNTGIPVHLATAMY